MKKIILISSITILAAAGLILFLVLSKNTTQEEIIELKDKYITTKTGLNLRSNPDKSSSVVTLIPFGAMVTIEKSEGDVIFLDGRYGKWVNVKYDNKTGWVFSGFLCDFKPDTIIKPVADFYRDRYRKNEYFSKYKEYTHFKDSEVSIENIIDNYIVLKIPTSEVDNIEPSWGHVVWRYDVKQENFFAVYSIEHHRTIHLLYLDKDRYPDLIIEYGCCANMSLEIHFGSENGFVKGYELDGYCSDEYYYRSLGSCGDMEFACSDTVYTENKIRVGNVEVDIGGSTETIYHYRFNCDKRKVEKYAEREINDLRGIITSIDLKNMSVVINDNKDLKDKSLKFHDKIYAHEYYKQEIKDLKKGDDVVFDYETIDDKKIILKINQQGDYGTRKSKVPVVGIDYSKNLLAVNYGTGTNYSARYLPDDIEFRGTIKNINDIKINEEVELIFTRGKLTAIKSDDVMKVIGIIEKLNKEDRSIVIKSDLGETLNFKIMESVVIWVRNTKSNDISDINEGTKVIVNHIKSSSNIYHIDVLK